MPRTTTLLIGSIGVLTESSDLQRQAFNIAFVEHGLDWAWSAEDYRTLLHTPGGVNRITAYAQNRGDTVDAVALHAAKVDAFDRMVDAHGLTLRPGIADLLAEARLNQMKIGFVTATSLRQIELIAGALRDHLSLDIFDYVGNRDRVAEGKPAPDIYLDALSQLGVAPEAAIALEDTPESAQSALGAGIMTFVYPGDMVQGAALPDGAALIDDPATLLKPDSAAA